MKRRRMWCEYRKGSERKEERKSVKILKRRWEKEGEWLSKREM